MENKDMELFNEFLAFKQFQEMNSSGDTSGKPKKATKKKTSDKYHKRTDGTYEYVMSIGRDADGKRLRKHLYASSVSEMDEKIFQLRLEVEKGTDFIKQNTTFQALRLRWWDNKQLTIKALNTKKMYLNAFNYLIPIEYILIKDITTQHLQDIINSNKEHPRTCQQIRVCLNEIFKFAISERIIYYNPCESLVIPNYKSKERRPLTSDEDYITDLNIFDNMERAFILIIKYCGLRKSEALALTKSDIKLADGFIEVNKALYIISNQTALKTTKNEKSRAIPIPKKISYFLGYYLTKLPSNLLFYGRELKYMSACTYRNFWKRIIKKMKEAAQTYNMIIEDDLTAHIFRHNYACMLMQAKIDMKERQYLLGHSSIDVTMDIYTHIEQNKMQAPTLLDDYLSIE